MKKWDVFISYSTIDHDAAFGLLAVLEEHGLNCWIAPRNIPQGAVWADEIDRAIQSARVFVVIVSKNSVSSKQVPKEVALAVSACESIFPLRIDDIGLEGSFRYYLSDYQFTDATDEQKKKFTELAEVISASLGRKNEEKTKAPAMKEAEVSEASSVKEQTMLQIQEPPHDLQKKTEEVLPKKVQDTGGKKRSGILIAVILAVLCAAAGGIFAITRSGREGSSADKTASVSLKTQEQTQKDTQAQKETQKEKETQAQKETEAQKKTQKEKETQAQKETEAQKETQKGKETLAQQQETEAQTQTGTQAQEEGQAAASSPLFGSWKLVGYEDRGAQTSIPVRDMYIGADGSVYFSKTEGLDAVQNGVSLPKFHVQENTFDYLPVITSVNGETAMEEWTTSFTLDDAYDGSITLKKDGTLLSTIQVRSLSSTMTYDLSQKPLSEDNPTGLTFEDCYPDRHLILHVTGEDAADPLNLQEIDTWIAFRKNYPLLDPDIQPTLAGDWEDSKGNRWTFGADQEKMTFEMITADGKTLEGINISDRGANEEKENFFERVVFSFDGYTSQRYAVVSYDGQCLQLLDEDFKPFSLTRISTGEEDQEEEEEES